MPIGILAEFLLGAPTIFVLIGAMCMIVSVAWLGIAVVQLNMPITVGDSNIQHPN